MLFFDGKPLEGGARTLAAGDPATWWEVFSANDRDTQSRNTTASLEQQLEEEADRQNDAILKAGGPQLGNPWRPSLADTLAHTAIETGLKLFGGETLQHVLADRYDKEVADLVAKKPELSGLVSPDGIRGLVARKRAAIQKEADYVQSRSFNDPLDYLTHGSAMLMGGIWGQRYSPADIAAMGLGVAQPMTKSLVANAGRAAFSNAMVQIGLEPDLYAQEKFLGRNRTLGEMAANVAMAGAMGGALDFAGRSIIRSGVNRFGRDTPAGTFMSRHSPRGGLISDVPEPTAPVVPGVDVTGTTKEVTDLINKARSGEIAAARRLAEMAGIDANTGVKGAFDRAEIEGVDDMMAPLVAALDRFGLAIDHGADERRRAQAIRSAVDPDEPPPARGPGLVDPARLPDLSEEAEAPAPRHGTNQHAVQLEIMGKPAMLRAIDLKSVVDDLGERVARIEAWNPERAGRALLLETTDGKLHAVDGRLRVRMAHATEGPTEAEGIVFREADGWQRGEVERLAAAKNVREGRRGLIETAEALRHDRDLAAVLAEDSDFDAHALALSELSEPAWNRVKAGEIDPLTAAMVASHVADEGLHAGLLDDLARAGVKDVDEARRLLGDLLPDRSYEAAATAMGLHEDTPVMPLRGGADVDDMRGPAAKAQVERMAQDLAPEIEQAKALAGEAAKTRDLITGLRRDIASLERHIDRAEAGRYVDPETGEAVPRRVVDAMIDLWKGVRDWRTSGRKPMRLAEFVRQHGGLKDEGGDVRQIIDRPRDRPGLLNNRSGSGLDDMALMAWERGYFEGSERPTIAEFLDRLDEDVRGNAVYSHLDREAVDDARLMDEAEQELERRGLRDARSRGDIAAYYQREGAEGTAGDQIAALRDQLAVKEQDLARAEDALRLFERGGAGDQGLDAPFSRIGETQDEANAILERDGAYEVHPDVVESAIRGLLPAAHIVPSDTNLGVMTRVRIDPDIYDPRYADSRLVRATFERPDGSEFDVGPLVIASILKSDAFFIGGEFTSDGRPAVVFLRFGLDRVDQPDRTLHSKLWHEAGHDYRARGILNGSTWVRLVGHARSLQLLDKSAQEIARLAGHPDWHLIDPSVTQRDLYHALYADAYGWQGRKLAEMLDQEEVSHFLEFVAQGTLRTADIEPVRDIIEWIASGEAAGRPGGEAAQWGHIDAATGKSMWSSFNDGEGGPQTSLAAPPKRPRDIDTLGYYSKALEAARGLKQAKGTPEQMLAQLKNAGVKDAEIEATGLKSILEGASITRDEIIAHLEGNRIGLREVGYRSPTTDDHAAVLEALDREGRNARSRDVQEELGDIADALREGHFTLTDMILGRDAESADLMPETRAALGRIENQHQLGFKQLPKWSSFSLDPSNPTNSETVLHLPGTDGMSGADVGIAALDNIAAMQGGGQPSRIGSDFRSGHFSEPNIIGHMQASLDTLPPRVVKDAEGHMIESGLVYNINQIQSDWGQKLRDGGVRDEAKIAELEKRLLDARKEYDARAAKTNARFDELGLAPSKAVSESERAFDRMEKFDRSLKHAQRDGDSAEIGNLIGLADEVEQLGRALMRAAGPMGLISAEIRTAKAAAPGHPLVNTTDQWVNTTLRRAIRQAVEANADYIAIPHGDTVLSYNPGDQKGMRGFYGSRETEGIVPKNLRKLLKAIDKDSPDPQRIEKLMTTNGAEGWKGEVRGKAEGWPVDRVLSWNNASASQTGFTLFPITEKVALSVMRDGQPMFSLTAPPRSTEPRLPLDDDAQQETAGRIMALANRILQRPDGGAERAVTERDAGNGLVNRVMVGEQAFEVDRAPDGTVAGLREVTPETTETLVALVKEIGGRAGIELDDAMALVAANRILDVVRNLSANAGEPMARLGELLQEMLTPPEPAKPVAAAPTPLARDLAEIDRVSEIGAVAKACRA